MKEYLDQVKRATRTDLYFLTLAAALVVPDMCAGLEADDGRTNRTRYEAWFDEHVAHKYVCGSGPSFSAEDCYGLRCAMLHQGRLDPHRGAYERVLFIEPNAGALVAHNNVMNDALNIDVTQFTLDMVESAEQWLLKAGHTHQYQANLPRFMQRHPAGLEPYIVGLPVIA